MRIIYPPKWGIFSSFDPLFTAVNCCTVRLDFPGEGHLRMGFCIPGGWGFQKYHETTARTTGTEHMTEHLNTTYR